MSGCRRWRAPRPRSASANSSSLSAVTVPGSAAKRSISSRLYSRSPRGSTYGAERWKTTTSLASAASRGRIWIAEAPVPISPTRLPTRDTFAFQRAECHHRPPNPSRFLIGGIFGSDSRPVAMTRLAAEKSPRVVRTSQRASSSLHCASDSAQFSRR